MSVSRTATRVDVTSQTFPPSAMSRAATRRRTLASAEACCPLCGSAANIHRFSDAGSNVRMCTVCELFFVHPRPISDEHHRRVSSGRYPGIELLDCTRRYEGERLYYDRHFDLISRASSGAGSILDVGCGTGNLLERFSVRPNCYRLGIELNPAAARMARRAAHCEILQLPFEQFRSDRKFDVITMINVFSHVSSFDAAFRSLQAALAPGGRLILRTTEMSRHVSRWNQVHWGVPDDLHFLGLNTLSFICQKYGFKITRHVRLPFEDELFLQSRWQQMGRNRMHNAVKRIATRIPGALSAARSVYAAALGQRLFVSLIVLTMNAATVNVSDVKPRISGGFPGDN
jgi:SAM-dependent methyltransferase